MIQKVYTNKEATAIFLFYTVFYVFEKIFTVEIIVN